MLVLVVEKKVARRNNYHRMRQIMTLPRIKQSEKEIIFLLLFLLPSVMSVLCGCSPWRDNYNVNKWVFVMALSLAMLKVAMAKKERARTHTQFAIALEHVKFESNARWKKTEWTDKKIHTRWETHNMKHK